VCCRSAEAESLIVAVVKPHDLPSELRRHVDPHGKGTPLAQFKIYGQHDVLAPRRTQMSDVIHAATVEVLGLPAGKRFHRFFPMATEDFPVPEGRTDRYTIVEVCMFEGRRVTTKKAFYQRLYRDFEAHLGIGPQDLEIVILETPRHDWAIRGAAGDELNLSYRVDQ